MLPLDYFSDSVLQAPTIGCMLMCMTAAIVGAFQVLRGEALIGEVLSHASYPGVVLALLLDYLLFQETHDVLSLAIVLLGATLAALTALYFMHWHARRRVSKDITLTLTLASFFAVGLFLLSLLQNDFPTLERKLQSYLFGQAALMRDVHVLMYGILCFFILGAVMLFFRPIQATLFDPVFTDLSGISRRRIEVLLFVMMLLSIVIGIRSLGVVLISSQLLFPAAAARMWTDRLKPLLLISALFGALAGFGGLYVSHEVGLATGILLPTGPLIVTIGATLFFITLLLSPKNGLFVRLKRRYQFFFMCQQENLLKTIWKACSQKKDPSITKQEISTLSGQGGLLLIFRLCMMQRAGWLQKKQNTTYLLTAYGQLMGRKIVRLHRLWELYLVKYCGVHKNRVHPSAEEMEHILTADIERELTTLFHNPTKDPHLQPIPKNLEGSLLQ